MRLSPNFVRDCPNRREFAGTALAGAGLWLLPVLGGQSRSATAESCILIFLNGGMSHLDTFDPKPGQPAEIRGEFATIQTAAPGMRITAAWSLLAEQARLFTIVRSVGFEGRLANHSPACYHMLTGVAPEGEAALLAPPQRTDHPSMGSAVAKLISPPTPPLRSGEGGNGGAVPAYVMVPDVLIENAHLTPGQFAGWLGTRYEAFCPKGDPSLPTFGVPSLARPADVSETQQAGRRRLLEQVDAGRHDLASAPAGRDLAAYYERAFELLSSGRAQAAFNLSAEPAKVRERYGRSNFGQSVLLARRLVEAGVRFVNVHWPNVGGGRNWDTHSDGFRRLKEMLIPPTDRAVSALLADLAERGRLATTLVVVLTEFGRAPQIGKTFQNAGGPAGRDHWSNCFSILLAGGGVRGGRVYGSSDAKGAYPVEKPLTPADVAATIYYALGIDPNVMLYDVEQRTHLLCAGKAMLDLLERP